MSDDVSKPFADWLVQQRKGVLNLEAGSKLAELVAAVTEIGKAGTLTLSIRVTPGKAGSLEVTDEVKTRLPEPERPAALWFADEHHNLTRSNPDQLHLGIRVVAETGEVLDDALEANA